VDKAQFRADFPEFASTTDYTNAMLDFWSSIADKVVSLDKWGTLFTQGASLFVAHNLVLQRRNINAASGGVPGNQTGMQSSKAVGRVSVGYDNGDVALENGGAFNLTTYGMQYLQLARMIGVGGVQL
jgi:hypothetical protein